MSPDLELDLTFSQKLSLAPSLTLAVDQPVTGPPAYA